MCFLHSPAASNFFSIRAYCNRNRIQNDPKAKNTVEWELFETDWRPRYGHSVILFKEQLILIGGFGVKKNGSHGRLKDVTWLKFAGSRWVTDQETVDSESASMYTSRVLVGDGRFVVYGGRTAPTHCVNESPRLMAVSDGGSFTYQVVGECGLPARFRHTAVVARNKDVDVLFVFGGRTSDLVLLNDSWMMPLGVADSKAVLLPPQTSQPEPRFSHSAAVRSLPSGHDEVWVSGGLGRTGPLGDIWCLDVSSLRWRQLTVTNMAPRFGHCSTVLGSSLVMVGGVSACDAHQPGVAVLDLLTGVCNEYQLPSMHPEKSMLLINHSLISLDSKTLWIIGGGGNCFSFGTYFNSYCAAITAKSLNL